LTYVPANLTDPAAGRGTSLQNSAASEWSCYENGAGVSIGAAAFFVTDLLLWQYSRESPS